MSDLDSTTLTSPSSPPSISPLLHLLGPLPLNFVLSIYLTTPSFSSSFLQGNTIESEHLSELTEEEYEAHIYQRQDLKGFMWLDAKYLNPFFTRRLTQEVRERGWERQLGHMILLTSRTGLLSVLVLKV